MGHVLLVVLYFLGAKLFAIFYLCYEYYMNLTLKIIHIILHSYSACIHSELRISMDDNFEVHSSNVLVINEE